MTPEELHYLYKEDVRTMPEFTSDRDYTPLTREQVQWQARTLAHIELQENVLDTAAFKDAMMRSSHSTVRAEAGLSFFQLLTTAVTRAELRMPAGARGAFVPIGNHFDALRAITEIMQGANQDLLIVDPYADESVLLRFAGAAREGVKVRVLRDVRYRDCGTRLNGAKESWVQQYREAKPLEIRSAAASTLHDRFIAQDGETIFLISQSLKDLALRSPATIQKADPGIATEKIQAYEVMWANAAVM
ncbi:hypothetical protein [Stenotrophomonas rhizophila]|uniref:hypothetical protein n=1 Tax=Stenotrophomonas rhizophila TaxID=216778 RepID=UPI0028A93480|nr:hypothetical protein [Stenotrophomonas rhizophila]